MRLAAAVLLVLGLCPATIRVGATEASPDTLASLRVPGGVAALMRAAELDASTPRAESVWALSRVIHSFAVGTAPKIDRVRDRVTRYLETISAYEEARNGLKSGGSVVSLADPPTDLKRQLERLAAAMGSQFTLTGGRYQLVPGNSESEGQRREWLKTAGLDVEKSVVDMNAGLRVPPALPGDEVPLPLPEPMWRSLLPNRPVVAGSLSAAILTDRRAALLYVGLLSTSASARAYFASQPRVLEEVYRTPRVAALAKNGRSIRLRDGRIDVPGGIEAVPMWEHLVGASVSRPDQFLLELLGRDDGHLAALYDAVGNLSGAGQAFALGLQYKDEAQRASRLKALYAAGHDATASVRSFDRPFSRDVYDAAHILLLARFDADGRLAGPAWKKLWNRAFATDVLPENLSAEMEGVEEGGLMDAADLVERVCITSTSMRRERAEMWLFAQRVFAGATPSDLPLVLFTLRGYPRFGALILALERMGVTRPAVFAAVVARANRFMSIGDQAKATNAHALFQGALVLIERARLGRAIDPDETNNLVISLANTPLPPDEDAPGAIASWIASEYLVALGMKTIPLASIVEPSPIERYVLGAFAGRLRANGAAPAPVIEIEGLRYRVDPAAREEERLRAIRREQGGATLDEVIAFAANAAAAGTPVVSFLDGARRAELLEVTGRRLIARRSRGLTAAGRPPDLESLITEAAKKLRAPDKRGAAEDLADLARSLQRAADYFTGEVLLALAYAPHLGAAEGTVKLTGDPSLRHDWMLAERLDKERVRAQWRLPVADREPAGGWRVTGSLLAMDVGLGQMGLRRVFTESLPEPPTISMNDRAAFTEGHSLANTFDYRDDDRDAIAEALTRGRARVEALQLDPAALDRLLVDAGIRDSRRTLLPWVIAHEPDRVADFFSIVEWLRLGLPSGAPLKQLDAWGASGNSREACLCLMFPGAEDWESLAGRRSIAGVAPLVPDMALLVAESLRVRRLPAALTKSILAAATQDFEDDLRLAFEDDWMSMVRQVRKTLPPRMDDYIASLTTNGPLIPER